MAKGNRARSNNRVPVMVTRETYNKLKHYSSSVGAPITRTIDEAVEDWVETVGSARIEAMATMSLKRMDIPNVVNIDTFRQAAEA